MLSALASRFQRSDSATATLALRGLDPKAGRYTHRSALVAMARQGRAVARSARGVRPRVVMPRRSALLRFRHDPHTTALSRPHSLESTHTTYMQADWGRLPTTGHHHPLWASPSVTKRQKMTQVSRSSPRACPRAPRARSQDPGRKLSFCHNNNNK